MHDRDGVPSERLEPGTVRTHLLDELAQLPPDEHLAALEAVDRHDVEIVLTDRATITVIVAERWEFTVPASRLDAGG